MIKLYDVAVVGLGTMGGYAALELASRGYSVLGFDRFAPPHSHGSHSGESRIYRVAYPEGSSYVPLVREAGKLWEEMGQRFGVKLLERAGMLHMGVPESEFIAGVAESAQRNGLDIVRLQADEVQRRYPAFRIPDDYVGMFDAEAGWLDVNASATGCLHEAAAQGANLQLNTPVLSWSADGDSVRVVTADREWSAARLVIAGGAWAGTLLQELQLPLTVRRKVFSWFEPRRPEEFATGRVPVFTFPEAYTYGFPNIGGGGVKLAEHYGGNDLADADGPIAPPNDRDIDPLRTIIAKYMPGLSGENGTPARLLRVQVCLYTLTPDEDFVVDLHPEHNNVVFAAGFSGHGFKFAPIMGRALADLSIEGRTALDIEFMSLRRFKAAAN